MQYFRLKNLLLGSHGTLLTLPCRTAKLAPPCASSEDPLLLTLACILATAHVETGNLTKLQWVQKNLHQPLVLCYFNLVAHPHRTRLHLGHLCHLMQNDGNLSGDLIA